MMAIVIDLFDGVMETDLREIRLIQKKGFISLDYVN